MIVNNYSLSILEAQEDLDGYVLMQHGTQYRISISNDWGTRCSAKLVIDGLHQGTWLLSEYQRVVLERPAHDPGKFTFYKAGSKEGDLVGISATNPNTGLVQVTFIPEKAQKPQPEIIVRTHHEASKGVLRSHESLSAGGTGLSGESSQKFSIAEQIEKDETQKVIITLRLVARENDGPRPLTNYSNPVPPPV